MHVGIGRGVVHVIAEFAGIGIVVKHGVKRGGIVDLYRRKEQHGYRHNHGAYHHRRRAARGKAYPQHNAEYCRKYKRYQHEHKRHYERYAEYPAVTLERKVKPAAKRGEVLFILVHRNGIGEGKRHRGAYGKHHVYQPYYNQ